MALPPELAAQCTQTHDAAGALITPGLIDCHTHLVYGGDRAQEFEQRLNGASYEDIARAGGGIASTVQRHPPGRPPRRWPRKAAHGWCNSWRRA